MGEKVLSYASPSDLCKIDTLNKQFQRFLIPTWEKITEERFGMKNGKDGYRQGISFLRKPVYIHINSAPGRENTMYYAGSPKVATSDEIIVITSDDATDDGAAHRNCVYDARDLHFKGEAEGDGGGRNLAVCGQTGAEVIASNRLNSVVLTGEQSLSHK